MNALRAESAVKAVLGNIEWKKINDNRSSLSKMIKLPNLDDVENIVKAAEDDGAVLFEDERFAFYTFPDQSKLTFEFLTHGAVWVTVYRSYISMAEDCIIYAHDAKYRVFWKNVTRGTHHINKTTSIFAGYKNRYQTLLEQAEKTGSLVPTSDGTKVYTFPDNSRMTTMLSESKIYVKIAVVVEI